MPIRKTIVLIIFLLNAVILSAQSKKDWADSIYNYLEKDQSEGFRVTRDYADSLLFIFEGREEPCKWVKTQIFRSKLQMQDGNYKESLRSLFLALNKVQKGLCSGTPLLSEIYLTYASLYYTLDDPKAKYYVKKGIDAWKPEWKKDEVLIHLYIQKGSFYKELDMQIYYYRIGYKIAQEIHDLKMQEYTLNSIGIAYAMGGENELSIKYFKEALTLAKNRNAYGILSGLYNNLAGLSTDQSLIGSYLDSAYYFAKLSGDLEDKQISLVNKAYYFYNNSKFKDGYDVLWESLAIKDSLFNENKIKAFADMEQKYESEKKMNEIALLKSENEIEKLQSSRRLGISIGLGTAMLVFIFVTIIFYSQNKKKQKLNTELLHEKKKSDDLLLNILPEEVADELKNTGTSKARLYNNVSVLFTDFVNFTGISSQMNPTELVQEIHANFTVFDAIIEKHGLEKIKTIGDAYLAVCGLPHETEDHAKKVVQAAIEIQTFMNQNAGKFQIRIGIHSGAVVAGIVGVKKYAYDIWGDTVNMAARMEQNSEAGKINISGDSYELIKNDFTCLYRGKITAKNKGEVDMYFVSPSLNKA